MSQLKVLLVEDHEYSREAMSMYLERDFEVLAAADGVEALELLKSHPEIQLLLTDWMMPRMDGLELCKHARKLDRDRYLHIIVFTARTQKEDLLKALDAGADAFVHKPVDLAELQAQIQVARRIIDLQEEAARRLAELDEARNKVTEDLLQAGRIQASLLPQDAPRVPGFRFAWGFLSSNHVGGDMFGIEDLGNGQYGIYVLDVCGAGAHAALLAVSIGWVMTARGLLCVRDGAQQRATPPAAVARELNRRFPVLARSDQYFTLLYGVLDTGTMNFDFVRAGHPAPVLLGDGGPVESTRVAAGPPLGVLSDPELEVEPETHVLRQGQMVLLYTDGLLRALGEGDRPVAEPDLARHIQSMRGMGVDKVIDYLITTIEASRGDGDLEDDVAIIGFEVLPQALPQVA